MTREVVHGVRMLGAGVPYLDGAEDKLYEVISGASDRSSRSDELASHISDWPTRYHLSRLRANLLLPFVLGPTTRALDVGCGTGALTRELAERGCQVTGLEGALERARSAAARTMGLANCEIVSGSLAEYVAEGHDGEFDVVVLCGVLEYSGSALGGKGGPAQMLAEAQQLLKPDGVVLLAIENQLGLKYLLGYPEDHRGLPWVGIGGYRSPRNLAHTWSRAALSAMLSDSGLTTQEWLFPYPDYKLPTAVVHTEVFDDAEGRQLLKQFIRTPVRDYSGSTMLTVDGSSAFGILLDAGLGPDTANSFLVVAGGPQASPARLLGDAGLWVSSGERSSEFLDLRAVQRGPDGWRIEPLNQRMEIHRPPLHSLRSNVRVVVGSSLEDEVVQLAHRISSPEGLQPLLAEWWAAAVAVARPAGEDERVQFDVMPRNFIRSADGELIFVDSEWNWTEPVPDSWMLLRSMWYLITERLWPCGAMAGLSWQLRLSEAALALTRVVDPAVDESDVETALDIESQLQARVTNGDVGEIRHESAKLLSLPLTSLTPRPALVHYLERPTAVEEELRRSQAQVQEHLAQQQALQAEVARLREVLAMSFRSRARRVGGRVKRKLLS